MKKAYSFLLDKSPYSFCSVSSKQSFAIIRVAQIWILWKKYLLKVISSMLFPPIWLLLFGSNEQETIVICTHMNSSFFLLCIVFAKQKSCFFCACVCDDAYNAANPPVTNANYDLNYDINRVFSFDFVSSTPFFSKGHSIAFVQTIFT